MKSDNQGVTPAHLQNSGNLPAPKPSKCKACKKPLNIKFAVEMAGGYMHQSCFRKAI